MPLTVTTQTGGEVYAEPFVGPVSHTAPITVDPNADLDNAVVDADGYLKPGTPLQENGSIVTAPSQTIFGIVPSATKVAAGNTAADLTAGATRQVIVATICQINRAVTEDNLGRVLSVDELSAIDANGAIVLID